jgi:hypothetical protein
MVGKNLKRIWLALKQLAFPLFPYPYSTICLMVIILRLVIQVLVIRTQATRIRQLVHRQILKALQHLYMASLKFRCKSRIKPMKRPIFITFALLVVAGCTAMSPIDDHGGHTADEATDGSSSPLSREQAIAIARLRVDELEHWHDEVPIPNHLTRTVSYAARRINKGSWRVIAHSAVRENRPDGGGGSAYDSVPAAIVIIDKRGAIISYSHSTDPYLN